MRWRNGVTGYALAPSEFRAGLSIWGYSEGGLLLPDEYSSVEEWLGELVGGLEAVAASGREVEDAEELWESVRRDLPKAEPPPTWTPPIVDGTYRRTTEGVVDREEAYRDGRRHGKLTWWHLIDELPQGLSEEELMSPDVEITVRQGPVVRSGTYVDGAAHGEFRFFDDRGRPTYEVVFERGYPSGTCVVFPEAALGLCEQATIRYDAGVPVEWSIPEFGYSSVKLVRVGGETTLKEYAGGEPLVLVDCLEKREHAVAVKDEPELEGVKTIGVAAEAGHGRLGSREIEIVGDARRQLGLAYGHDRERLMPLTYFRADGSHAGGSRLSPLRGLKRRLSGR
jgi:hypothetical protein